MLWLKQGCPHGDVLVLFQIAPETPTPGVRVARPKLGPATSLLARENRPQKPPTLPPPVVGMGNELVVDAGSRSLDVSRRSNFDVAEATSQVKLLLPKFHRADSALRSQAGRRGSATSNGYLHREAFEDAVPLEKNLDRAVLVHQAIHNGPRL